MSDDWKKLQWSLQDDGSGQGTFVNQVRLERGQPHILNADDLIGFGSSDTQSSRTDGQESFVYRLRAPAAFQSLEADDLELPDCEAPTPPPPDLPDLVPDKPLVVPSIANLAPLETASISSSHVASSSPSTSSKLPSGSQRSDTIELISLTSSEDDRSMSPVTSPEKTSKVRTDKKRSQDSEEPASSKKKVKKLKALFSSDEEEPKEKSEHQKKRTYIAKPIKSNQKESKFPSQYSPISSDDDFITPPSPELRLPKPFDVRMTKEDKEKPKLKPKGKKSVNENDKVEETGSDTNYRTRLSDEIVLLILSKLSHKDLVTVSFINKKFRDLSRDDSLWTELSLDYQDIKLHADSCRKLVERCKKIESLQITNNSRDYRPLNIMTVVIRAKKSLKSLKVDSSIQKWTPAAMVKLGQMEELKSITMTFDPTYQKPYGAGVIQFPRLDQLEVLCVHTSRNIYSGYSGSSMSTLKDLKKLKKVDMCSADERLLAKVIENNPDLKELSLNVLRLFPVGFQSGFLVRVSGIHLQRLRSTYPQIDIIDKYDYRNT